MQGPVAGRQGVTMLIDLLPLLPLLLMGVVAGLLSGLLGIGGGLVFAPMLLLTGLPPHEALATSTVAIVPTTLGGTWSHLRQGHLAVRPCLAIGVAAAVSGVAFSRLGGLLQGWHLLALQALMYAVLALTIEPRRGAAAGAEEPPVPLPGLVAVGGLAGFAGGLLGVGGGLMMVPLMVKGLRMPLHAAIRLSTLAVLCSASAASVELLSAGRADAVMALSLGGSAAMAARWSAARLDTVSEGRLVLMLRTITVALALDSGRRGLQLLLA